MAQGDTSETGRPLIWPTFSKRAHYKNKKGNLLDLQGAQIEKKRKQGPRNDSCQDGAKLSGNQRSPRQTRKCHRVIDPLFFKGLIYKKK